MRPKPEIMAAVNNLADAMNEPCDCAGTRHEYECREGGRLLRLCHSALLWALGIDEGPFPEAIAFLASTPGTWRPEDVSDSEDDL